MHQVAGHKRARDESDKADATAQRDSSKERPRDASTSSRQDAQAPGGGGGNRDGRSDKGQQDRSKDR